MMVIILIFALTTVRLVECATKTFDGKTDSSLSGFNLASEVGALNPIEMVKLALESTAKLRALITNPTIGELAKSFIENPTIRGYHKLVDEIKKTLNNSEGTFPALPTLLPPAQGLDKLVTPPSIPGIPAGKLPTLAMPQLNGFNLAG